jgi:hypothetical protein
LFKICSNPKFVTIKKKQKNLINKKETEKKAIVLDATGPARFRI